MFTFRRVTFVINKYKISNMYTIKMLLDARFRFNSLPVCRCAQVKSTGCTKVSKGMTKKMGKPANLVKRERCACRLYCRKDIWAGMGYIRWLSPLIFFIVIALAPPPPPDRYALFSCCGVSSRSRVYIHAVSPASYIVAPLRNGRCIR